MSGLAPREMQIAVDSTRVDTPDGALRVGQIVHGRITEMRSDNTAVVDVLGRSIEVVLPEMQEIGNVLSLRILDVREDDVDAQLVSRAGTLPAQNRPAPAGDSSGDVVRNVRRLVDAAADRLFGARPGRPASSTVRSGEGDSILRVAVRGERPAGKLLSFEPETLSASAALAAASSEELLAAQAVLERLDMPLSPLTIAAALPDANDPARLVAVLQRLNATLSELTPEGRINTLLTLAEFLSQIRPEESAVDAQVSSFVDQIAGGGERKLLDLLVALAQRGQSSAADRLLLTARATERATSLTNDIKTQLLAVSNAENPDSPLAALLTDALEAVTAAQLTSLNAARNAPGAIAFVLPILIRSGGTRAAQVTVQRDTPEGRNRPLDAGNFKISFVLETRRLGTVRMDIEAVARALRVTVEAQTTSVAEELRAGLDPLREALEKRGYRSVAMTAQVVRRLAYRDEADEEEQRTYVPTLRQAHAPAAELGMPVHLDTRA